MKKTAKKAVKNVAKKAVKKVAKKEMVEKKRQIIITDPEIGKQAIEKMIAKIGRKVRAIEEIKMKEDFYLSQKKYPITIAKVKTVMISRLEYEIKKLENDIEYVKEQVKRLERKVKK